MDICLTVLRNPNAKRETSWRPGGVVDVSRYDATIAECIHPRLALVQITGLPDKAPTEIYLRRLKRTLEERIEDYADRDNPKMIRQRRWHVKISALPLAARQALEQTGVCTVTWAEARPTIFRRIVVQEDDESLDTLAGIEEDDL